MFQIHLRDISLSAPLTAGSPAEVTDLKLVRDLEGHLKLHGSIKAPVNDINGLTLTSISSITVNRDDRSEPVASLSAVNPGATVEFDDTDIPAAGTYTPEPTGSLVAKSRQAYMSARWLPRMFLMWI